MPLAPVYSMNSLKIKLPEENIMALTLPELGFDYDALGDRMSKETFEYHRDKHHQAYINKANELTDNKLNNDNYIPEMLKAKDSNQGLFNQLGQHYNHSLFWDSLSPQGGGDTIPGELGEKIKSTFGSFDAFKEKFVSAGGGQFGSGWVWLAMADNGELEIMATLNADNPLTHGKTPLIVCDVWEHAYYIDYRNARPKFLETFVDSMANWENAARLYDRGPVKAAA